MLIQRESYLPSEHTETSTERLARLNKRRKIDVSLPLSLRKVAFLKSKWSQVSQTKCRTIAYAGFLGNYSSKPKIVLTQHHVFQNRIQIRSSAMECIPEFIPEFIPGFRSVPYVLHSYRMLDISRSTNFHQSSCGCHPCRASRNETHTSYSPCQGGFRP